MKNAFLFTLIAYSNFCFAQASFCIWECDDTIEQGCHSCGVSAEFTDYLLTYVECPPNVFKPPTPSICGGPGTTENNVHWYSFTASSAYILIEFEVDCAGNGDIQVGIQSECGGGCLVSEGCTDVDYILEYDELVVGDQYYFYVDGCYASTCDILINISGQPPLLLDEPYAITAYNNCKEICETNNCSENKDCNSVDVITVFSGEYISFSARHQGDSPADFGDVDGPCSYYPTFQGLEFHWTFMGDTYTLEPFFDDAIGPTIEMPLVTEETLYEICLERVSHMCDDTDEELCIEVLVRPLEREYFFYDICAEDLAVGWEIPSQDDPGNNGYSWKGETIFLGDVKDNECIDFFHDSNPCGLPVPQSLCIDVKGSINPVQRDLYMYNCQFDKNGFYDWTWPVTGQVIVLDREDEEGDIYYADNQSLEYDDDGRTCDSVMYINIHVADVPAEFTTQDCSTVDFTDYYFSIDVTRVEKDGEMAKWPDITGPYFVTISDVETGEVIITNQDFNQERPLRVADERSVEVSVTYSFNNGIWGDDPEGHIQEEVTCETIYGPFLLTNTCREVTATCPSWERGLIVTVDGIDEDSSEEISLYDEQEIFIRVEEDILPDQGLIEWWVTSTPNSLPDETGTRIGSTNIQSNWKYGERIPELLAISYNDMVTTSEYMIIGSGSGFIAEDLMIELDQNCDTTCPDDCEDNIIGSFPCLWNGYYKEALKDCENIIPLDPTDHVPPNSIVVVYVDQDAESMIRSAKNLCSMDGCIYVMYNPCERCLDGFADEGEASYEIMFHSNNATHISSLSYTAQPEGGTVNSSGDYSNERDSLPSVNLSPIMIKSEVEDFSFALPCGEYSGTQYVQGKVIGNQYTSPCCDVYTPLLTFNLECDQGITYLRWISAPGFPSQLPDDIEIDHGSCETPFSFGSYFSGTDRFPPTFEGNCAGLKTFSTTHYPDDEFPEGTTNITFRVTDDCGNELVHNFDVTVVCDDDSMGTDDQIFLDFPFLSDLVDPVDCEGTRIEVYLVGSGYFLYVENEEGGTLYYQDGTLYCRSSSSLDCVEFYGLGLPDSVWECGGGGSGGSGGSPPEIFTDYPWLSSIIDPNDCEGVEVELYEFGNQVFPYVITDDSAILYSNTGQVYCRSALPAFDCISIYGLSAPVDRWSCDGGGGGQPTTTLFDTYPWLSDLVDPDDCGNAIITLYDTGSWSALFVESEGTTVMFSLSGQRYCQDSPGFICAEAYGFTDADIVEVWECTGLRKASLSVRERATAWSLEVYPNPSISMITIEVNPADADVRFQLLDAGGQIVISGEMAGSVTMDLSDQPSGVYFVRIVWNEEVLVKKVLRM